MNRSRTVPGKVLPVPFPAVKTEPAAHKSQSAGHSAYLEQKGTAKNDYDKALDFFLDLNSDFGVDTK